MSSDVQQAFLDFLSRLTATVIGVFVAGVLLLVLTRAYVGWEVEQAKAKMRESLKMPAAGKLK